MVNVNSSSLRRSYRPSRLASFEGFVCIHQGRVQLASD